MSRQIDKLKSIIAKSPLAFDERQDLISVLSQATDSVLRPIAEVCSQDTRWIEKIYENYKSKKVAIAADDPEAWERIIRGEEQMLREMAE